MNQIIVRSDKKNLNIVLSKINEALEKHNPPMKSRLQLEMAIEELFVNICSYAYPDEGDIVIQYCVEDNSLKVIVNFIDNGIPFNPLEKEEPDLSLGVEEREIGGLGLTLVRKNVDSLDYKYENNYNILTLEKIFEIFSFFFFSKMDEMNFLKSAGLS